MSPPLVGGGQGRTPSDLCDSAGAVLWAAIGFVVLLIVLVLGGSCHA